MTQGISNFDAVDAREEKMSATSDSPGSECHTINLYGPKIRDCPSQPPPKSEAGPARGIAAGSWS